MRLEGVKAEVFDHQTEDFALRRAGWLDALAYQQVYCYYHSSSSVLTQY